MGKYLVSRVDFELHYILIAGVIAIGLVYLIDFVYKKLRQKK